ncbi:MAG: succinate dehydrogenase assembly factor 2 [Gammaproteobacteria bacterium]|nr:succinate dehydrogenase assembly factor 2 [Gammaproteobacteria bacterium]
MTTDALYNPGALRWRCRRGMLELDLMLQSFVDNEVAALTSTELEVFDRLLDYPDQLLLELFLDQTQSSDKDISQFVKRIRQSTNA